MHSLLKHWLQKFHNLKDLDPRPCVSKDARERLEPSLMPTRYVCEDLTSEFAKYWAKVQEDDGEGLEEIQLKALDRWNGFRFNFGRSTDDYPLPLSLFVDNLMIISFSARYANTR